MATTALDIIREALENIAVKSPSETVSGVEEANLFRSLNFMLDTLSADNLMVYCEAQETFPLTSGKSLYTIGAGGNFNTDRPVEINVANSYIRDVNNIDTRLLPMDREDYNSITMKSDTALTTTPDHLLYDQQYPLGLIQLYPCPASNLNLILVSHKIFTAFTGLNTAISFPPGYKELLSSLFSIRLSAKYEKPVPAAISAIAQNAITKIQARNFTNIKKNHRDHPHGTKRLGTNVYNPRTGNF
jgi:hypothetical protein